MMEWPQFVVWAFLALVGGGCSIVIALLAKIFISLQTLNTQVGQILTTHTFYEKRFEDIDVQIDGTRAVTGDHENRITRVENHLQLF